MLGKRPLWVVGRWREVVPSFSQLPILKGGRGWEPAIFLWLGGVGKWGKLLRGFMKDLAGSQSQREPGARNQASQCLSADITGEKPRASPWWRGRLLELPASWSVFRCLPCPSWLSSPVCFASLVSSYLSLQGPPWLPMPGHCLRAPQDASSPSLSHLGLMACLCLCWLPPPLSLCRLPLWRSPPRCQPAGCENTRAS